MALALAMAFAPTPGEAASQRIHVIAKVAQQRFTGDLASPKLGDRIISNVELFDDSDTKVGAGAGVCTIVSIQESPPDSLVECLSVWRVIWKTFDPSSGGTLAQSNDSRFGIVT